MKSNVQNWPALNIFSESIDFDPIVFLVSLNHKRLITALILFVLSLTITEYAQSEPIVFTIPFLTRVWRRLIQVRC